jgi:hypothetical protein
MYPYLRLFKEFLKFRRAAPLAPLDTHVSHHLCWPQDIDPWMELNNGRTLTLFDLGRIPMAMRVGLDRVARARGWGLAVAGASVRYRRRVKMFDRIEMRTRLVGWDGRFRLHGPDDVGEGRMHQPGAAAVGDHARQARDRAAVGNGGGPGSAAGQPAPAGLGAGLDRGRCRTALAARGVRGGSSRPFGRSSRGATLR